MQMSCVGPSYTCSFILKTLFPGLGPRIESGVPFPFPFSSPLPSPMSRRSPAHCGFCDRLLNEPPFRRCGRCRSTLYCDRCTYMPRVQNYLLGATIRTHSLMRALTPALTPPPPYSVPAPCLEAAQSFVPTS